MKLTLYMEHDGFDDDKEAHMTILTVPEDVTVSRLCSYFAYFLAGAGFQPREDQRLIEDQ